MARFLAAFLLLILLVQSAPLLPLQAGGCSMPCCKRSGGRAACCPRPSSKPMYQCVPSQKGLFFDPPQRQSA